MITKTRRALQVLSVTSSQDPSQLLRPGAMERPWRATIIYSASPSSIAAFIWSQHHTAWFRAVGTASSWTLGVTMVGNMDKKGLSSAVPSR
ncbi:hypothetical protein FBEOM_10128 [Fusarium beomiforme]|uniref:Uncharacterized protein n=1 Tax=Fusarium beomiforme TaxID=44412 RepID=A0A9P5DUK5_9HYPO|nr:hypothetical protein FBEOM_10128 [Fusarium beomiforme]